MFPSKSQRQVYRKVGRKSVCRKLKIANPNKCKKMKRSCKIARGSMRSYCRKKKATRYNKRRTNPNTTYGLF